jgi:hypothetical protein
MVAVSRNIIACILLRSLALIVTANAQTPTSSQVSNNMTSDVPSTTPSVSNVINTKSPTRIPTKAPLMVNTTAPSASATPTSSIPTVRPTISMNTAAPVVPEGVSVTIDNIQISFTGVSTIESSDLLQFQATIEVWFESFFNEQVENRQRYLHHQNHRQLQQYRVPFVQNMDTSYAVVSQDTSITSGSNAVTFTQTLSYSTTSESEKPQSYALLPFADANYKELLLNQLVKEIGSLINLSAISTPVIIEPVTIEDNGLSTGAIVGVVLAAVFCLLLMACAGYFIGKQKSTDMDSKGKETVENGTGTTINERQNETTSPTLNTCVDPTTVNQKQQYIPVATNETRRGAETPVLNYKDQTRTVICPIVEAIPDPKKPGESNSIIPIASLIAI